jgi:hypothetical protein
MIVVIVAVVTPVFKTQLESEMVTKGVKSCKCDTVFCAGCARM